MVVGEEDLPEVDQAERRAEQLALRALGAVEEQPLPSAAHEHGGRRPLGGRHRAGGAQEDDVEVHAPECRPGLRQAELLARVDERAGQVVPVLEAPHGLAGVAAVVGGGDRPDVSPACTT